MQRDNVPLRPIEGATETDATVQMWLRACLRVSMGAFVLMDREREYCETFLRPSPYFAYLYPERAA